YRDYVIRSFNEDKPYARFVQEQVAGDVLFPAEPDGVLGLGFLAAGPWDFIGHWEVGEGKLDGRIAKHLDRDEMLSAVFNVFQSTTVQCAQCHHHKFDPIRMEDYYRLHAVFAAVDRADRDIASLPAAEQERKQMLLARRQELLAERERLKEQQQPLKEIQTQLASVESALSQIPAPPQVFAVTTHFSGGGQFKPTEGRPREIRLLHRGDLTSPGDLVSPGAPQLWEAAEDEFFPPARFSVARPWLEGEARAELARYLTAADNPLVWRSIANRLWGWTFGTPLVGTLNDFGRGGMQPTHPQLLDYLAAELRDDPRQSLKSIIRLLVTSRTYRRSSRSDEHSAQIDAGNAYLWRANRRRLTAEEFRDSLLAASGILNRQAGGPSFRDFVIDKPDHSPHYEYHLHDPADTATHRRSIYRFVVRSQPHPLLTTLDCADPSISFPRRDESTTALQALAAWNNRFVEYTARKLAERMERHGLKSVEQIDFACRQVLGRGATPRERALLEEHLNAHGSASVARVLFNMNAFFYLD
ncbi:MAG: DUF1553 domain-containing protein, partial [Planctomycetales bacterium]|nr:DUF1553 domain-containing protein [Planctomycetales bacterium]